MNTRKNKFGGRLLWLFLFVFAGLTVAMAGTADSIAVYSQSMKKNIPVMVIKPSSYNKTRAPLNVVYLLHGYSGNHRQWLRDAPQLTKLADVYNLLIVCPDGGFSSWYFDSPIDSTVRYETFMTKELINYVDKNYRTIATRTSRAISGLSMGGHGGLFLASRHTDLYGTAGSMAGGVNMRPFRNPGISKKGSVTQAVAKKTGKNTALSAPLKILQTRN